MRPGLLRAIPRKICYRKGNVPALYGRHILIEQVPPDGTNGQRFGVMGSVGNKGNPRIQAAFSPTSCRTLSPAR